MGNPLFIKIYSYVHCVGYIIIIKISDVGVDSLRQLSSI